MILNDREFHFLEALLRLRTTHEEENRHEHDRCRELLAEEAARHGLAVKIVPSHPYPSLLAGTAVDNLEPRLMLGAHLDVVPAALEQYEPVVLHGKLKARGASDMKFAVPLFFKLIDDLDRALRNRVLLVFTFDEEIGGRHGTRYLLEEYSLRPKVGFVPDGGDGFQIEADEKGVLQFRIRTAGRSAHGSRPWLGENAIDKLLAIYHDLRRDFPVVGQPGQWVPTLSLGKVTGGQAANQVPDSCEALLDIRFTETTTLEKVIAHVERVTAGRGEFSTIVTGDPYHLDPNGIHCRWLQEASARHRTGATMPIYRSEGASDARFFTKYGIPVVIAKPVCGGHHSTDEWVDLASLEPYYRIILDFTRLAAGGTV